MIRFSGEAWRPIEIKKEVSIVVGPGSHAIDVFDLVGNLRILDQSAEITEITTLTDCTNVYATLFDGTVSKALTVDGIDLSGVPVGSMFVKDQEVTQAYSLSDASECQVNEILKNQFLGKPFNVTQKSGASTTLRFHLTTTDDPLSFKMLLRFEYKPLDGGYLKLLL